MDELCDSGFNESWQIKLIKPTRAVAVHCISFKLVWVLIGTRLTYCVIEMEIKLYLTDTTDIIVNK